ncbi:MAG: toll/interleukin-1 receptor domain-containing protein [Anaerolineae bacterium]|nr:toll/interleukin-1 receptor domain-containing protein [Anaerolineae bacterium]
MTEDSKVFISYARSDGEDFAKELFRKLEDADIPCWLDRAYIVLPQRKMEKWHPCYSSQKEPKP